MELYVYSALVTMATGVLLFILAFKCGLERGKGKVQSFETYSTDNKDFLIARRVHMNTVENAVVFLPLLWVATVFSSFPQYAGIVGAVWVLARMAYAYLYYQDPKRRAPAFVLSMLCMITLLGMGIYGSAMLLV